jgi:LmbE family N-acetylglucosaminyl deacetylase
VSIVLVLAAHPDDEVLGVGGAIARHSAQGDIVHVAIAAEGVTSRDAVRDTRARHAQLEGLKDASRSALRVLGGASVRFLGFPDNRCDSVDLLDLVKAVEAIVAELRPDIVYVHHAGDLNVDHRRLHEETPSSTEWAAAGSLPAFQPTVFVDISGYWPSKLAALECYRHEMRDWPHARSIQAIEHLGHWRGATAGLAMAEAFVLLREVVRS